MTVRLKTGDGCQPIKSQMQLWLCINKQDGQQFYYRCPNVSSDSPVDLASINTGGKPRNYHEIV